MGALSYTTFVRLIGCRVELLKVSRGWLFQSDGDIASVRFLFAFLTRVAEND
jgi:hypothetical protein